LAGAALLAAAPAQGQLPEISEQEFTCLALNIYHEARNQPIEGQLAVAHVTLNRADMRAPTSICSVVYRGAAFSWTRDPRKQRPPSDQQAWTVAQAVARWALADRDGDPVLGSTFFHSVEVAPDWAPFKVRVRQIGDHVFYRDGSAPREERASAEPSDNP
jgi:spore germination cell wall hydrolase CwlJ-like protein